MRKKLLNTGIIALFILTMQDITAQKRLYIANDDHTDFMWTRDSAQYVDGFVQMLDRWMYINDSTKKADPNPNFHSKWNCDGSFWVSFYEKAKGTNSPGFDSLKRQIRDGQITVPYSPLVTVYGGVPVEGVLRGMYYAGDLERRLGIDLSKATAMENQTMPLGLSSLWKGAGAKYAWHGVCNCDTKMDEASFGSREKEMYWYKGLDTNKILLKWYKMVNPASYGNRELGGYAEVFSSETESNTLSSVDSLSAKCNTAEYPYNIGGAFGVGHDAFVTLKDELVDAARTKTIAGIQDVIVSNESDFFKDFETTYGATLPSVTKTFGNEWDINCASIAEVSAKMKRSFEKLRAAEAMAAIVISYDPTFMSSLDAMRKNAWEAVGMYWEHSLGFKDGVTLEERNAFQRRMENSFTSYVDALYNLSKTNLGGLITNGTLNQRFFVFNPLSWVRTDYADYEYSGSQSIHVVDVGSGKEAPMQFITKNGVNYLRILASNIPSVGYKVYEIRTGAGVALFDDAGSNTGNTVENEYFRIDYTNQGVLTSIFDKKNSKELVALTNNRYVNDMGSGNANVGSRTVDVGKVSITITTQTTDFPAHTTKITLFKDIERIEIDNQITENFSDSVRTWSYSFNAASPEIWHEETGAVIKAKLSTNGGHYSAQNARYDWSTLNHFASVNEPSGFGISLSNQDCYFMQIGSSTVISLDENSAQLNVLAGGTIGGLGILNQGDDTEFNQRFAISTHTAYNTADEMKKALEHQNFLVCGTVVTPVNFLLPNEYTFLSVDNPETILWSVKPAEESVTSGVVARAWNLSDADVSANLTYDLQLNEAYRATHVETTISTLPFAPGSRVLPVTLGHNEMKTFRANLLVIALAARQLKLTGKRVSSTNEINWVTNNEEGVKNYIVEKSTDGTNFIYTATVNPVNGSYFFSDININTAIRYFYRIKLVSIHGTYKYSNTILINEDKQASSLLVFPNPVADKINASLILGKKTRCNIMIVNATGAVVKTASPPLFERGYNTYTISIKELPAGEYNFVIIADGQKFVKPFLKK